MEKREGSHLGKMFATTLAVTTAVVFGAHYFGGFEISLLFAICWLTAVTATVAVGIENVVKGHE